MENNISYCGIDCEKCAIYKATKKLNKGYIKRICVEWSKYYNKIINEEDIKCYGCKDPVVFKYCKYCDIKECNNKKGIMNCINCEEYKCERLYKLIENYNKNKEIFELIEKTR